MTGDANTWRISYKVGNFHGTLASCSVEGHTQFAFGGREGKVTFDAEEAEFLYQALGAFLSGELGAPMPSPIPAAQPAPPIAKEEPKPDAPKPTAGKASSNAGRRWTEEDDAKLITLFNEGKQTLDMLSAEFNRSPAAIASRLFKHDLIEMQPKAKPTV